MRLDSVNADLETDNAELSKQLPKHTIVYQYTEEDSFDNKARDWSISIDQKGEDIINLLTENSNKKIGSKVMTIGEESLNERSLAASI